MESILCGAAALLLRIGLALYLAGLVRSKNSAGTMIRVACDLFVAVLAFWAVGAAILLQQHNGFFWVSGEMLLYDGRGSGRVMFLAVVVSIAGGAVVGAMLERSRFFPPLVASAVLAGLVVPVAGAWVWGGWLERIKFIDVGGASFIHVTGGVFALVAAKFLGPREGKYNRDGSASMIPGHSVPLASAGVLVMLAGWVPYVGTLGGNAAGFGILLSASAGGLAGLLLGHFRYGKPDVLITWLGVLGALVAGSAGAGVVPTPAAVLIGAGAGVLVPLSAVWIDLLGHVDDPAGSVAIHGVGGAFGIVATGIFAPGSFLLRLQHFGASLLGLLVITIWAAGCAIGLFTVLKKTTTLRAPEADEFDGLDLAQHDIGAYPDFQQNSIRSYHLREA